MRWTTLYRLLFLYRCTVSVLAELVVRAFTPLGDASKYGAIKYELGATFALLGARDSTELTKVIGTLFGYLSFGQPMLINLWFQAVGFYGIWRFLAALPPEMRKPAYILMLLPSFTLWSSIASKESIVLFAMGVLCGFLVDLYYNRAKLRLELALAVYLMVVYKVHFLPPVLLIAGALIFGRYVERKIPMVAFGILLSFAGLYVFQDKFRELSMQVEVHFADGGSSRPEFFVNPNDIFDKAPEGMWLGFYGPTVEEAVKGHLLQKVAFIESGIIVLLLGSILVRRLPDLPLFSLLLWAGGLFWILFMAYPASVYNPGSAIRYRAGYILFVIFLFLTPLSREVYMRWLKGWRTDRDGTVTLPPPPRGAAAQPP